ncbi:3D domain-containing protein [Patescibacteria group bacterium]|nr:3D domain-containing protein [Patescibacteria group bacterium]
MIFHRYLKRLIKSRWPIGLVVLLLVLEWGLPQHALATSSQTETPDKRSLIFLVEQRELVLNNSVNLVNVRLPQANEKPAKYVVRVPVTAYSSTPDQTDDTPFITARGTTVRPGIVAANFLPFGAMIRMPSHFGNQVFVVEDRMNTRYDKRVDIWMESRQQAKQWGLRHVAIEVL